MLESTICIIPARGGSKQIPNKNLQILGEHTLVGHSIKHALLAGIPRNNIVVSSDSSEILSNAMSYGVVASQRPEDLASDTSSTEDTLLHVCNIYTNYTNYKYVLLLQPTSPIRFVSTVRAFLDAFFDGLQSNYDSIVSVSKFYDFFWSFAYDEHGEKCVPSYQSRPMRQQMSKNSMQYFENGSMYMTTINMLNATKNRCGGRVNIFPITDIEGLQIDSHEDLQVCKRLFSGTISDLCLNTNYQSSSQKLDAPTLPA